MFKFKRNALMKRLLIIAAAATLSTAACGGGETSSNAANNNANTQTVKAANSNALPPGLSTGPVAPNGNSTPGIPAPGNMNANVKRGNSNIAPPDPAKALQPQKPGATPTPGIDPETAKRQMRGELQPIPATPSPRDANTSSRPRNRIGRPSRPPVNDQP